jgi:hypothetical protein
VHYGYLKFWLFHFTCQSTLGRGVKGACADVGNYWSFAVKNLTLQFGHFFGFIARAPESETSLPNESRWIVGGFLHLGHL